ncbi:methylated-DNA--[protein]-cysteine S-methyltransferase [Crocinitomicaceae bacterium]|nr:methylated-DNA--[protein]-cysteine S-methyltransferase [Crocinitomicaceae bacterium]MDB3907717.1 methylated-DNA--[protein]-cysteine S-methyltransferase [Crocinitomicaceae bacterium]
MSDTLHISVIPSPVGELTAGFTSKGLALLSFSSPSELELSSGLKEFELTELHTDVHEELKQQLHDYFDGELKEFNLPLDLHGTDFQKKVWNALLEVPFGITRSYKEQATFLGDVKAIRAVATANGANPVAIVVPCHRIIGSNQSLTGYAGGLERKQFLLELESNQGRLF